MEGLNSIFFWLALLLLLAQGAAVIWLYRQNRQLKRQLRERPAPALADERAYERITARLNPHLFKNILNSIQSHAYQTYFSLDKLSGVLDYILYDSNRRWTSINEEVAFALNLIEINKIKVSPLFELSVRNKIKPDDPLATAPLLAPLISIDLIENAFKHADLQSPDAFIAIVFELKDGIFSLTVSNKTSGRQVLHKERSGIGARTLEERLQLIYPGYFSLSRLREEDVFTAQLKIRLLDYQTEMHTAG